LGQGRGVVAPAILAVGADEIGVAEAAQGLGAVLLAPRPQIAAGKAQEDGAAPRLHALSLQRKEYLFDRVAHGPSA